MNYKQIEFEDKGPHIGLLEVQQLARELNLVLPEDYAQFLLSVNGGWSRLYKTEDEIICLENWLSINPNDERAVASLSEINRNLRDDQSKWKDYVVFATDIADNYLALKFLGPNSGWVYFYDWHVKFDVDDIIKLYPSFTDFVGRLVPTKFGE